MKNRDYFDLGSSFITKQLTNVRDGVTLTGNIFRAKVKKEVMSNSSHTAENEPSGTFFVQTKERQLSY